MSGELKPCPFCGKPAHIERGALTGVHAVVCDCASHVFYGCEKDERRTAEVWNTRPERTCRNIAEEWRKQYYGEFQSLCGTAFVCSECGARLCDAEAYYAFMGVPKGDNWKEHKFEPVHYCPNCGAKVVE